MNKKKKSMKTKKKPINIRASLVNPKNYAAVFEQLKVDIQQTQLKAALSITKEVILFYWRTGKLLSKMISTEGWGAKTLEKLSKDILRSFPDIQGCSLRNLQYMRKFAESYPEENYAAAAA